MKKNPRIKDGPKDLVGGPIQPHEVQIRVSMMIEGDLLDALKAAAKRSNVGYTTLMKEFTRAFIGMPEKIAVPGRMLVSPSDGRAFEDLLEEVREKAARMQKRRADSVKGKVG